MDLFIVILIILIILAVAASANLLSRLTHPYRVTILYKNSPHKAQFNVSFFKYTRNFRGEDSLTWNQLEPKSKPLKVGVDDVLAIYSTRRLPFFLMRFTRTHYLDKRSKD